jgi:hypothetical protein
LADFANASGAQPVNFVKAGRFLCSAHYNVFGHGLHLGRFSVLDLHLTGTLHSLLAGGAFFHHHFLKVFVCISRHWHIDWHRVTGLIRVDCFIRYARTQRAYWRNWHRGGSCLSFT